MAGSRILVDGEVWQGFTGPVPLTSVTPLHEHDYEVQPRYAEVLDNEYVIICLTCGECRKVSPD